MTAGDPLREALDRLGAALDGVYAALGAPPPRGRRDLPAEARAAGLLPAGAGPPPMTPYAVARRFRGVRETAGVASTPVVLTMLQLDRPDVHDDAVPWCSAYVAWTAWIAGYERSTSLRARTWLRVGAPVPLDEALEGDVVVLARGRGPQPGPDVIAAPGHVGYLAGRQPGRVRLLGGNQGDEVSLRWYGVRRVLGVRRLRPRPEAA